MKSKNYIFCIVIIALSFFSCEKDVLEQEAATADLLQYFNSRKVKDVLVGENRYLISFTEGQSLTIPAGSVNFIYSDTNDTWCVNGSTTSVSSRVTPPILRIMGKIG